MTMRNHAASTERAKDLSWLRKCTDFSEAREMPWHIKIAYPPSSIIHVNILPEIKRYYLKTYVYNSFLNKTVRKKERERERERVCVCV